MGELFEKSSPIPPQKLSDKGMKNKMLVRERTVGARINLAFAVASRWAPPAKKVVYGNYYSFTVIM